MYNAELETFLRVAEAGSFNKAAKNFYITPTAVIKKINLLEASLGVKLFERSHRGLTLTEAGKSLYRDAKYIIQYCDDAITRAKNAMQKDANLIRIGSSPLTPPQMLVHLWPKLHEYCPDMKFEIVPYENNQENAKNILASLGENIDIVAGIFDKTMLELRHCAGFELSREPLCCIMSIHHRLAEKDILQIEDLYGENLLMIHRGWSYHMDQLRDDILQGHSSINIVDFDLYETGIFNRCENSTDILLAIPGWAMVHPLLKVLPVEWNYTIPYGILYAPTPSETVKHFLSAAQMAMRDQGEYF